MRCRLVIGSQPVYLRDPTVVARAQDYANMGGVRC